MRRPAQHSRSDWQAIHAGGEASETRMAALPAAGASPTSPEAMDAAESMREHIERWFYPCSHPMHVGLADMYVADPRFAAHYDNRAEGLAAFVASAIRANADRSPAGPDSARPPR
jgi:MerR family transcriptional regulator, thiopeptide resistance regulator